MSPLSTFAQTSSSSEKRDAIALSSLPTGSERGAPSSSEAAGCCAPDGDLRSCTGSRDVLSGRHTRRRAQRALVERGGLTRRKNSRCRIWATVVRRVALFSCCFVVDHQDGLVACWPSQLVWHLVRVRGHEADLEGADAADAGCRRSQRRPRQPGAGEPANAPGASTRLGALSSSSRSRFLSSADASPSPFCRAWLNIGTRARGYYRSAGRPSVCPRSCPMPSGGAGATGTATHNDNQVHTTTARSQKVRVSAEKHKICLLMTFTQFV